MKSIENPFHEGERRVQTLAGETETADQNGVMISSSIMKGALPFLHQQSFVVVAVHHDQRIWCCILFGKPGFMT